MESILTALNEVDLDVKQGEFVAVLGHNGSGTPLSLLGECSLYFIIPTDFKLRSTRFQISDVGTPIFSGPNATSSSTTLAII